MAGTVTVEAFGRTRDGLAVERLTLTNGPGMQVSLIRTVTMPDGSVKHYDNYLTRYQPWNDFYTYGAGVAPPAGVKVIDARVDYSGRTPPPRRAPAEDL